MRHNTSDLTIKYILTRLSAPMAVVVLTVLAVACSNSKKYHHGSSSTGSMETLLEHADSLYTVHDNDSALACYRRLAQSYRPDMTVEQKTMCMEGFVGCWKTNFIGFGNFNASLQDLLMAEEIAYNNDITTAKMDYCYGLVYILLSTHTDAKREGNQLLRNAGAHLKRAFYTAYEVKDTATMYRAFDNMVTVAFMYDMLDSLHNEVEILEKMNDHSDSWHKDVSLLNLRLRQLMNEGNYQSTANMLDSIMKVLPPGPEAARYNAVMMKNKALCLGALGRRDEAYRNVKDAMRLSYEFDMKDVRFALLNTFVKLCGDYGDDAEAEKYYTHSVELRDSMLSYETLAAVSEMKASQQRRELQKMLALNDYKRSVMQWGLCIAGVLIAALLLIVYIIRSKNRKLRERGKMLYHRMAEMSEPMPDDRYAVSDVDADAQGASAHDADIHTRQDAENVHDADDNDEKGDEMPEQQPEAAKDDVAKYANSRLSEQMKRETAASIREVIEKSDAVFSSDFSLQMLAEKVGTLPKYVSQVIHESFRCNFSTLVNTRRVKEACRRFDMPDYRHYSVEGIGQSVGFQSRSAFSTNFKKITGLSIREYRNIAKSQMQDVEDEGQTDE